MNNNRAYSALETINGVIVFRKKGFSDSTSEKRINFEKHHITVENFLLKAIFT